MTHTEKVHVIFGLLGALAGGLAWWSCYHPGSRARLVWAALAFLIGFFLFIPVEAQTRTYKPVGWLDTLLSAIPESPQYWLGNWFSKLSQWHVLQHKIGGLLIMVVGVVEWRRGRGRPLGRVWDHALPLLLVGIGLSFGVHGGIEGHLQFRVERVHHWIFGAAFIAAGVTLLLAQTGRLQRPIWRAAWAILIVAVSLNIAFFYRLDPSARGTEIHHHEGTGPGMR